MWRSNYSSNTVFGNQCSSFGLFDQNSTCETLQNSQLPLLPSTSQADTLPILCLCDFHTHLTYRAALALGMPRPAMVRWILSSHWELRQQETRRRGNNTGTTVLIPVQLVLLRGSSINRLCVKQLHNDITVLLQWAGCGFNCPCSGKDQFSS